MDYTKNYKLRKPAAEDFYDVEDFNRNSDAIDDKMLVADRAYTLANELLARVGALENLSNLLQSKSKIMLTVYAPEGAEISAINTENQQVTGPITVGADMETAVELDSVADWQIVCTYGGEEYVRDLQVESVGHTVLAMPVSLADAPWAYIDKVSVAGLAETCWWLGDSKKITVDGAEYEVVILGFNHDDLADPMAYGHMKAGISFGMTSTLAETYQLHPTYQENEPTTWLTQKFRLQTLPALLATMPADLQAAIKPVRKWLSAPEQGVNGYDAGVAIAGTLHSVDKLFLFSDLELFGVAHVSNPYYAHSHLYEYYRYLSMEAIIKDKDYWLRDHQPNSRYGFICGSRVVCATDNEDHDPGEVLSTPRDDYYGVCFGFCV